MEPTPATKEKTASTRKLSPRYNRSALLLRRVVTIWEYLTQVGIGTTNEISQACGISKITLKNDFRRLAAVGLIEVCGRIKLDHHHHYLYRRKKGAILAPFTLSKSPPKKGAFSAAPEETISARES